MKTYSISVVGATGLVGQTILKVLEEFHFPIKNLIPVASEKSVGGTIVFKENEYQLKSIDYLLSHPTDIAIFSAGKDFSLQYASLLAEKGTIVIDNSSAWRNFKGIPLVVPEVNGHLLTKETKLIANPNCSTIQLMMALFPLHKSFGLEKIVVTTYQSVSGSGVKGIQQLKNERNGLEKNSCYPYPIDMNLIPQGGNFLNNGYSEEEMKLINESQKILDLPQLMVTPTVVRVPVVGGHSEAVTATFSKNINIDQVKEVLAAFNGICLKDNIEKNIYPMPLYAKDSDKVFVGRIRKDLFNPKTLNMWIVSDNLRKGAATNAVQIALYIIKNQLV